MTQRAYRGRSPSAPMDAESLARVISALENQRVDVWLDGGWGVDALLGEETRAHDDLDLVVELRHSERVLDALAALGCEHVAGRPPTSFVCVDPAGLQVDVHPVTFDRQGNGIYVMDDGGEWVYPAQAFSGRGTAAGKSVRCLSPEVQVLVHGGYELGEKDYLELFLLLERFSVEIPPGLAVHVAAAGERITRP